MIEYILTIFIVAGLFVFYKAYYAPKRQIESYKKHFEMLGYKVFVYPFSIFGSGAFSKFIEDTEKHSDAMYTLKRQHPKYDIVIYNTFFTPTIQFLNPQLIKQFMLPDNVYTYQKMQILIQNVRRSLGHGIAFSEGKQWKKKRGIMNAVFNFDFLMENIPKIIRICQENLQIYEKECQKNGKVEEKDGKKVYKMNMFELFAGTFSNVMLQCFFGTISTRERINNQTIPTFINNLNADITQQNFELPILLFGEKFANLGLRAKDRDINNRIRLLRQLAQKFIDNRLAQLKTTGPRQNYQDIIEALVLRKNLDSEKRSSKVKISSQHADNYDFKQLIDEFCTFFTAGTDTTSHFTQMMIYYISINKQIRQKLQSQIDEHIKSDADINKQNLKKITYLDWIQNETTRYYGPGNGLFLRIAQKDNYIGQIPIKKGTAVSIQPFAPHFSEKYYKNPYQFRPQRWESECNNNHPYAFVGFSGGPRTCIGKHLALLQSKIAVIKFMKRYQQFKLPKQNFKMLARFLYQAEQMQMEVVASN